MPNLQYKYENENNEISVINVQKFKPILLNITDKICTIDKTIEWYLSQGQSGHLHKIQMLMDTYNYGKKNLTYIKRN